MALDDFEAEDGLAQAEVGLGLAEVGLGHALDKAEVQGEGWVLASLPEWVDQGLVSPSLSPSSALPGQHLAPHLTPPSGLPSTFHF